ncbi:hypothetical protein HYPSUDRAFT_207436 [Hypholoma sublateritium FD-334 SS-4]|uniref:Uncharacterized protein n=1 Tax=Hypholoma sublateritium (strain FD-334 SS-4) TaxID=945553 RepID=A0A0D2NGX2_HYPSF|nr:hypothetical protein HYPSUDRAFT_207436 [Hypholoma sublateritium FD-334 SS-4]
MPHGGRRQASTGPPSATAHLDCAGSASPAKSPPKTPSPAATPASASLEKPPASPHSPASSIVRSGVPPATAFALCVDDAVDQLGRAFRSTKGALRDPATPE